MFNFTLTMCYNTIDTIGYIQQKQNLQTCIYSENIESLRPVGWVPKVKLWLYLLRTPDQGICKLRTFASPRPQPPLVSLQPHVSKMSRSSQKGPPVWLGPLRQVPEPSWWDATRRAAAESPAGMIGTELPPRVFPTDPSAPTCPEVRSDHYFVNLFCTP